MGGCIKWVIYTYEVPPLIFPLPLLMTNPYVYPPRIGISLSFHLPSEAVNSYGNPYLGYVIRLCKLLNYLCILGLYAYK